MNNVYEQVLTNELEELLNESDFTENEIMDLLDAVSDNQ